MKRCHPLPAVLALWVFSLVSTSMAQRSLEERLRKLPRDAAMGYVSSSVSYLGADLNGGWFHSAPTTTMFKFHLEFGVVAMGVNIEHSRRSFSLYGTFHLDSTQAAILTDFMRADPRYGSTVSERVALQRAVIQHIRGADFVGEITGPTVIGSESDNIRALFGGSTFTVTDPITRQPRQVTVPAKYVPLFVSGLKENLSVFPVAVPQLTIGTLLGSQFSLRYLPTLEVGKDVGKVQYFGIGVQHNPLVWFTDSLFLDASLGFFTQEIKVGSYLDAKATAFGLTISKRLGWDIFNLTPYAGFLFESSTITFSYDHPRDTSSGTVVEKVSFLVNGENKNRITVGASLRLPILNINADYSFGKVRSASAGVMLAWTF